MPMTRRSLPEATVSSSAVSVSSRGSRASFSLKRGIFLRSPLKWTDRSRSISSPGEVMVSSNAGPSILRLSSR